MTTCLGKSCSFGLLCVSFVNFYQFGCVFLSLLILRVGCMIWFIDGLGNLHADQMFRTSAEAKDERLDPVKPV